MGTKPRLTEDDVRVAGLKKTIHYQSHDEYSVENLTHELLREVLPPCAESNVVADDGIVVPQEVVGVDEGIAALGGDVARDLGYGVSDADRMLPGKHTVLRPLRYVGSNGPVRPVAGGLRRSMRKVIRKVLKPFAMKN